MLFSCLNLFKYLVGLKSVWPGKIGRRTNAGSNGVRAGQVNSKHGQTEDGSVNSWSWKFNKRISLQDKRPTHWSIAWPMHPRTWGTWMDIPHQHNVPGSMQLQMHLHSSDPSFYEITCIAPFFKCKHCNLQLAMHKVHLFSPVETGIRNLVTLSQPMEVFPKWYFIQDALK